MPQYRVTKPSQIGGSLVAVGTTVEYDGLPGSNLEPTDAAGEKRKAEWEKSRKPVDANEAIGRGMAKGFSEAQKAKPEGEPADPPTVIVAAGDAGLTTVGHTSVSQVSAGGVDAENLLESDGKGGLVAQNPHSDAKPATKADSPDDGRPKLDADGKPATSSGAPSNPESNAVKAKRK